MAIWLVLLHVPVLAARAQDPSPLAGAPLAREALTASTPLDASRPVANDTPVPFVLSRPLTTADGDLVLLVNGVDVTALSERTATGVVYRPRIERLPAGEPEIALYTTGSGAWTAVAKVTLRVLHGTGFQRIVVDPSATLGNKGQVAQGQSASMPAPERPTFQDVVVNGALSTTHEHARFTVQTSSHYVGVSRREEALRFGQEGADAPRVDLADYRVDVRAGPAALSLGHTSFGSSRHLVNGFGSRGATMQVETGGTRVGVGALHGSSLVGWDQLLGLDQPNHRVLGAFVGREFLPQRPGGLKVEATMLDASVLPLTGYRQGAVLDAEASMGGSLHLTASTPGQRLRLNAGLSRSRFDNPGTDAALEGDTVIRAVERETRMARFLEGGVQLVQGRRVGPLGALSVDVNVQHERVDPMYRSVPTSLQADLQRNAADASLSLGPLRGQLAWGATRDNLARLATIPTTLGENRTANVALPLAPLMRAGARREHWWPVLSAAFARVRQRADGTPAGGLYSPTDLPDQVSATRDLGAQWQVGSWRLALRHNRVTQDNRQPGRELADFSTGSDALSVGTNLGANGDVALDLGDDFQLARQRNDRTTTRRATLNVNLRRGQSTSMVVALSLLRTRPPNQPASVNGEQRIELTQPLAFLRDASGAARGQGFVRFARSTARLPDLANAALAPLAQLTQRQWSVATGLTLTMF